MASTTHEKPALATTSSTLGGSRSSKPALDLRNSAVARLLQGGTYPGYPQPARNSQPIVTTSATPSIATETNTLPGGVKIKTEPIDSENSDNSESVNQRRTNATEDKKDGPSAAHMPCDSAVSTQIFDEHGANEEAEVAAEQMQWQCRYCSFVTSVRGSMYKHIKMHLNISHSNQAKATTRPISQITQSALYDYLADRSDTLKKTQDSDTAVRNSPTNSSSSFTTSAADSSVTSAQPQNTASNFLKSIVKTIMENKKTCNEEDDGPAQNIPEFTNPNPGMYYSISSGRHLSSSSSQSIAAKPNRSDNHTNAKGPVSRSKRKRTLNRDDEEWTQTLDQNEIEKLQDSVMKTRPSSTSPYKTRSRQLGYRSSTLTRQLLAIDSQDEDFEDPEDYEEQRNFRTESKRIKTEPEDYNVYHDTAATSPVDGEQPDGYDLDVPPSDKTNVYPTQLFQKDSVSANSPHVAALLNKNKLSLLDGSRNANTLVYNDSQMALRSMNEKNMSDRSVQCTLLLDKTCSKCSYPSSTCSPAPVCSQSEDSHTGNVKCDHCGIDFKDEVMCSIHMGCHSHVDPFTCNICGRSCGNKYTFYTHIMRGHQ